MAKCEFCDKGVTFGIKVSHSHRRSNLSLIHILVKQRADVIRRGIALRLPRLRHDVADIDLQRAGVHDRVHDAADEEVRDDAGIETPRPEDDHIGLADGLEHGGQRLRPSGTQTDAADAAPVPPLAAADARLSRHARAVFQLRFKPDRCV